LAVKIARDWIVASKVE